MSNTMQWPYPGLGHAPSYQVSGIPFVTGGLTVPVGSGTPLQITFPYVTKNVTIHLLTKNKALRAGFSAIGVSGSATNYFVIDSNSPSDPVVTFDTKCSSIFLISNSEDQLSASIFASLTSIPISELANSGPKGANWSGSSGVG